MSLHLPTLFLMTVVVTFVVGVLFLLSWRQARHSRALAIWGVAHLGGAAASGLLCLRNTIPDGVSIGLGNALLLAVYGLIWSGVRVFEGRPPAYRWPLAAGLAWGAACCVPAFYGSLTARVILASLVAGVFCTLCAVEIRRGRDEKLASRGAAVVVSSTYALLYLVRIPLALLVPLPADTRALDSPWPAFLCFAGVVFSVAIAFTFMALTKERAEHEQRRAARTDPLTGLANRRAFVEGAQAHLDGPRPVALLVFDLDHFKAVNDTYGHAVGDGVLAAFAHAAHALVPPTALLGRLGGEEFACVLPGCDAAGAARCAEVVRAAIAAIALPAYPDLRIQASVGVATADEGGGRGFDLLFRRADEALYEAKRTGRDRVRIARSVPRALAA